MSERIQYFLLTALFRLMGLLPFRALYLLSDLLAFLADDLLRYRRVVVEQNLRSSLPGRSEEELRAIRRKFYRFLTDYFLETAKMGSMSEAQIKRRMVFENLEEVSGRLRDGQSVSLLLGHYCNWEWVSSLPLHFPAEAECGQIYHTLHNRAADRAFLKLRSRFHATSIPMEETLRVLLRWRKEGKASVVGYIADQAPKYQSIHHWLDFLHHDTPVFTGPERISRKLRCAVYYLDMERLGRGRYRGTFRLITPDASREEEHFVTDRYFRLLQQTIEARPPFWLWSHKRWKRTRVQYEATAHRDGGC